MNHTQVRPAPQANNLAALASVVDAVADGCVCDSSIADAIGYGGRQGAYYPNGAAELGLIEEVANVSPREWQLTNEGATFVGLDAHQRAQTLVDLLCDNEWLNAYVTAPAQVEEMLRVACYEGETVSRRAACVKTWAQFVFELDDREQAERIATHMTGTRSRTVGARKAQKRAAPVVLDCFCGLCGTRIPAAAQGCEWCQ